MSSSRKPTFSSLEKVPPEIQSDIVDAIATYCESTLQPECKETLRKCLYVSPVFRWSARRHLFRNIRLSGENEHEIHSRLLRLRTLIDVPDLGVLPFIRDFDLDVEFGFLCTSECKDYGNHRITPFIHKAIIQNIKFVLDMLCHHKAQLETFNFRGPGDCSMCTMTPEVLLSLRNVIKSPYLASLKLCDVQDIPRNILHGTSITHLTIIDSAVSNCMDATYSHLPLPSLESVETDGLSLVRTLYPVHEQSTDDEEPCLSTVCLHIEQGDTNGARMFDTECATLVEQFPSVESLHIVFDSYDLSQLLSTPPTIDLTQHEALKYLTLHYGAIDPPLSIDPHAKVRMGLYAEHISSILQACPDTLRYLTIILGQVYPSAEAVASDPGPWTVLDSLLSVETFPLIEGIDIRVKCRFPKNLTDQDQKVAQREAERTIEMALPSPTEWRMMTVTMILY